jgi:hypothetical protein
MTKDNVFDAMVYPFQMMNMHQTEINDWLK